MCQLFQIYHHDANILEYKSLALKAEKRIRYIYAVCPRLHGPLLYKIMATFTDLSSKIIKRIVADVTEMVRPLYLSYIQELKDAEEKAMGSKEEIDINAPDHTVVNMIYGPVGEAIDAGIAAELTRLHNRAVWFYGRPALKKDLEFCNDVYYHGGPKITNTAKAKTGKSNIGNNKARGTNTSNAKGARGRRNYPRKHAGTVCFKCNGTGHIARFCTSNK